MGGERDGWDRLFCSPAGRRLASVRTHVDASRARRPLQRVVDDRGCGVPEPVELRRGGVFVGQRVELRTETSVCNSAGWQLKMDVVVSIVSAAWRVHSDVHRSAPALAHSAREPLGDGDALGVIELSRQGDQPLSSELRVFASLRCFDCGPEVLAVAKARICPGRQDHAGVQHCFSAVVVPLAGARIDEQRAGAIRGALEHVAGDGVRTQGACAAPSRNCRHLAERDRHDAEGSWGLGVGPQHDVSRAVRH